ncbi:hypothetical protein RJ640_019329 [Escallonia rubra]|uniref:CCHC-type domain-containing protein n=1 Tax=Escallonia rubra TaxID=112253 RepID=A0AA88UAS7_9ASTE|nr:hypothetical protein RJ640_019329 [Escallonia rubra]
MFRRNPTNQSHQRNNSDWNVRENSDACYECGRTGHIKKYCPQLRNKTANSNSNSRDLKEKKFKSRKALLTWDDSDESDKEGSEDEDVAQLCFMANDDDLKHNDIWLWHRRLGRVHMDLIKKLLSKDLVRGLPNLRFGLENAKPRGTPISPSVNLIKDENGKDVDSKLFRGMIGSLLYLTASRPDIMFSVCICARFQACPKESHLSAVKRIFKYLSGTLNLGLWYPRNSSIDLVGFLDSDYAGCLVDRKSTSGTCQFLGYALVSWHSKKQTSVALSTAEAEYVAAGSCCAQVLWMRQTLQDFGVSLALIPIMCDSSSAIDIRRVSDIVLRFELAPEASWFSERLETGHIKKYCPQLRNKTANNNSNSRDLKEKKFKSRKALLTWDDSDESDKEGSEDEDVAQLCFMANDDDLKHNDIWLWHRRLGHVHMDLIKKLLSKDLVRGLPNLREFEMSMMGELTFFLGLQIKQSKEGIFINQSKYTRELLKRFGLENAKPRGTPISPSVNLIKDENGKDVDSKLFRGMIGSLLYLTASRPDIMFSVCICARFQACPKESHLSAVKRIFKYLSGTLNLGLWYPRNSSIDLVGFLDSDYAGCLVDRKSTSGTCQFLGDALVSWHSKKQTSVALSTAEAEYVAAGSCCAQVLWMRQTLQDFGVSLALIPIMCDSSSAIDIRRVSDIVLRFELAPEASWFSERLE